MNYWSNASNLYERMPKCLRTKTCVYVGRTIFVFDTNGEAIRFFIRTTEEYSKDMIILFRSLNKKGEFTWRTGNKEFVTVHMDELMGCSRKCHNNNCNTCNTINWMWFTTFFNKKRITV